MYSTRHIYYGVKILLQVNFGKAVLLAGVILLRSEGVFTGESGGIAPD